MNYLKELNAFHEWLDTNPLSSGAIVLWYTLMAVNNKTNWIDKFTVANLTLQSKTGLSRQQLDRARTDLINAGRITYKKSNRANQAGHYSLVSFDTQNGHRADTKRAQDGHEATTLDKHKQNKNKNNNGARENNLSLQDQFQVSFGKMPTPVQTQFFIKAFTAGMEKELIAKSFEIGALAGSFNYTKSCLESWYKKGIKTLADYDRHEQNRKESHLQLIQGKSAANGSTGRAVPDDFVLDLNAGEEWE